MPNIKPVSDLRHYNEVLCDISYGKPVFLTKNSRIKYAIVDIEEYENLNSTIKLLEDLSQGKLSAENGKLTSIEEVERLFKL
ncbi:MAG: type II toxin-antitoxin system prevent-host-death family antitoxin [Acutalibacteraceae bacterium]|nr:type II toxin-antitoxin system prevent-host-death family antitoxin [Acutalibacteraceae bacterium]